MPLLRAQQTNVYHICQRCGVRWPLSQMVWQNGKLLCTPNKCNDTSIIGSRDLNVTRQLSVDRKEMEPDTKLTNPTDRRADQNECLY